MDLSPSELQGRVSRHAGYRRAFRREFGTDPTAHAISLALASYLRTLRAGDAPIDRYRAGDTLALSSSARRGAAIFAGKARCTVCHVGPLFSDGDFHNTGIAWRETTFADVGRGAVTGLAEDRGRFRTPSLRNVSLTAPYMHDGSKRTLADVIDFYDGGGQPNPGLDQFIQPLHLTPEEKDALVEFLQSLTSDRRRRKD
jgi:cytochrome c peroxidase